MKSHSKLLATLLICVLVISALAGGSAIAAGPIVTPGYSSAAVNLMAVRYKSFANTGSREIYLGIPDLGVAGNRVERDFTWGTGEHDVTFTYDPDNDKLTATVNDVSLEYPDLSTHVSDPALLGGLNYMQIDVVGRHSETEVDFNDVYLDGNPLGNFSGTGGWFTWMVTGYDFSQGFTLNGKLVLSGDFIGGDELSKVEIKVGYDEELGAIHARKYNDLNYNGEYDEGEPWLEGWEMTLKDDEENELASGTTDGDGRVSFDGLLPGMYYVCETLQPGWANSTSLCQTVILGTGGAEPGPTSTTLTVDGTSYDIEFLGRSDDGYTWSYRVTEVEGKDLSHWVLGLCVTDSDRFEGWSPTAEDEGIEGVELLLDPEHPDPTTGIKGIKWDVEDDFDNDGEAESDSRIFSVTFDTVYPIGTTEVGVKTGGKQAKTATGFIRGPHCADGPSETTILFGNYETGSITIEKETEPAGGTDFQFTGDLGDFTLDDGQSQPFPDLPAGEYEVTEVVPDGWVFNDVTCTGGDYESIANGVIIQLDIGESITCRFSNKEKPTAITLASFTAEADGGSVALTWDTAAEIDNAGFNVYRATAEDGPYTQVNGALIAAAGDPTSGASYSLLDKELAPGTYLYKLEDIDFNGVATLHGPVAATVTVPLRRPLYRPTMPH